VAAATAAEHPQASSMAAFFASLAPAKMDRLRSLMTSAAANNTALSRDSLTQIRTILKEETPATRPLSQRRNLSKTALGILASKRQAYDRQQSLIRGSIQQLLREYARGHPSEPKYKLDLICGSAFADHPLYGKFYHVNFMAATASAFGNTLFFAQFMAYHDYPKTSICCPLPQAYDTGKLN
jgi:hypothetical protein